MADLCYYASRPFSFIFRYLRQRPLSHAVILLAVLGAVACSVGTQYGVKFLVDTLTRDDTTNVWTAFFLLGSLIAADNLLWRVAGWIASSAFVAVSGDLRRDLFRHLTGHAHSYFTDRMPGMLTKLGCSDGSEPRPISVLTVGASVNSTNSRSSAAASAAMIPPPE